MRVGVHELAVDVQGDGEPVIFVHSSGLSGRQWRRWLPMFEGFRRLVPDLHGCGRNPPWDGPWPFPLSLDLDLVLALLEAHGPAHLVGHSYGGALSLFALGERPELVRTVTVYEPPLLGLLVGGAPEDRALIGQASALVDPAIAGSPVWVEQFVDWWNGPGAFRTLADPVRDELLHTGPKVAGEVADLVNDRRAVAAYDVGRPILVASGDRSPAAVMRALDLLATVPGAERELFPGLGHMAPLTHAEVLAARTLAFLRGR